MGFAEFLALEEVVFEGIEWFLGASGTQDPSECLRDAGQAEFALQSALECVIGEVIVGVGAVVVGQRQAGVGGEKGWEGVFVVWRGCGY